MIIIMIFIRILISIYWKLLKFSNVLDLRLKKFTPSQNVE